MSLRESLERVMSGSDLSADETAACLEEIVTGDVPSSLIGAFLVALRMKGESPGEVAGLARTMRANAVAVKPRATGLVDTCGTGGDSKGTANISTAAAFVVAGAGLPVAKHGNRALSSRSGSADVLEALGVPLDLDAGQVARCIDEAGIGFIFAPAFHPAMAKVMPVRRELAIRTAFNVLGPLVNPASPSFQLVGVGAEGLVDLVAGALAELGVERALVVHGAGGADELTCAGPSVMSLVEGGRVAGWTTVVPSEAGLEENGLEAIRGGTPEDNARTLRSVLEGKPGPVADCVLLNAGAALMAARRVETVAEGVDQARRVLDEGKGAEALDRMLAVTASF